MVVCCAFYGNAKMDKWFDTSLIERNLIVMVGSTWLSHTRGIKGFFFNKNFCPFLLSLILYNIKSPLSLVKLKRPFNGSKVEEQSCLRHCFTKKKPRRKVCTLNVPTETDHRPRFHKQLLRYIIYTQRNSLNISKQRETCVCAFIRDDSIGWDGSSQEWT